MTIENQNAYLIQLAFSLSLSAIHQELTEIMDDHEKADTYLIKQAELTEIMDGHEKAEHIFD